MPAIKFSSFQEYFTGFCPHSLYYGYNGTGKTTFAGRTGMRTILIDCGDSGVMTLRGMDPKKLRIIRIKSTMHYIEVMDEINRKAEQFDLLVADSLTGLQSIAIKEVKGRRGEMSQRKWGQAASKVIECISETKSFPKDIIYLSQEKRRTVDEGEGDVTHYMPSLMPSVREALSGSVDWVGRLYIEGGKRKLNFILSDTVEAKDRSSLFPKVLPLPPKEGQLYQAYVPIRRRIVEAIHE